MKNTIQILFVLLLFNISCSEAPPKADQTLEAAAPSTTAIVEDSSNANPTTIPPVAEKEAPKPTYDQTDLAILANQTQKSLFYKVGCCAEEAKRKQSCCCEAVVKKYGQIREKGDEKAILQAKTEDPIFRDCKQQAQWRTLIEQMEAPQAAEDEEEFDF